MLTENFVFLTSLLVPNAIVPKISDLIKYHCPDATISKNMSFNYSK